MIATGCMQNVVIEIVPLIPESNVLGADVVHRIGNVDKVLPELARHVFISWVLTRQLQRNCK